MDLRSYQKNAARAVVDFLRKELGNPCVVIPTGGGKTPIIAILTKFMASQKKRVLILAHRKELLEQTAERLKSFNVDLSLFSAGLNKKENDAAVVVGGIQSVIAAADTFAAGASFDYVIIDEAHLIPNLDDASSSYQRIIKILSNKNPALRVVGFTATPYRLEDGFLCSKENILNKVCFEVSTRELIEAGFLCPLVNKVVDVDLEETRSKEKEKIFNTAVNNMIKATKLRKKVLVFSPNISHAQEVYNIVSKTGGAAILTGNTPPKERERIIKEFKEDRKLDLVGNEFNPLKYLINVDILTTGFDAPNVDAVVLFRATESRALYVQILGRGLRLHPEKKDCLVLDFAGNIGRFGWIDDYPLEGGGSSGRKKKEEVFKICPECKQIQTKENKICSCGFKWGVMICHRCKKELLLSSSHCPNCGEYLISVPHYSIFENKKFLDIKDEELAKRIKPVRSVVLFVKYFLKESRKSGANMLLEKMFLDNGDHITNYILFEHQSNYAREKARKFWKERTTAPLPISCAAAFSACNNGELKKPLAVTYRPRTSLDQFPKILNIELEKNV